jgi:hypothetical protein
MFMHISTSEESFTEDPQITTPEFHNQKIAGQTITETGAGSRPLTRGQRYRPTMPNKAARRMSILRQALHLPKTLLTIYRIIREDFAAPALDEHLWAFWGFHQEVSDHGPWDPHYRVRQWQKAQLGAIGPQQVIGGLAVWELAFMMNVAMEIEDPIMEYSHQNGEGFRFLLPSLGRFMGKNEEQARYAAEHDLPWCESPWCSEERRHGNAFARMIERIVGISPLRENPNQPMVVTGDEATAVRHVINRQVTEWNASSSYAVMVAHAAGDLHILLRNIMRDEVKHLSVLSSADYYLFGPRPWRRVFDWIKLGIANYQGQRKNRSGGNILGGNYALSIEGIVAHVLTAFFITRWLRTVPLGTLATVFETPSQLPELAAFAPSPKRQAEIDGTLQRGRTRRLGLVRWDTEPRAEALAERRFEEANRRIIEKIVATELDGFHGAEMPGSRRARKIRKRIASLRLEAYGLEAQGRHRLRVCLQDRLRHYQIQNNWHILARMVISSIGGHSRSPEGAQRC